MQEAVLGVMPKENSHAVKLKEIGNKIDSLLDIRFNLKIKRIVSDKISKSDFKEIISKTIENFKNDAVKKEIESLFSVDLISMEKHEEKSDTSDLLESEGNTKGVSLVKRDGHYNSSSQNNKE